MILNRMPISIQRINTDYVECELFGEKNSDTIQLIGEQENDRLAHNSVHWASKKTKQRIISFG